MNSRSSLAVFFFLITQVCAAASGRDLKAGVSRVEITPPIGFPMGGYAARPGPSTGVHDPLYATVLLLKSDETSVAIISCDLRSFPSERLSFQVRGRKLADHVLVAATHTHSGPITWEDKSWPRADASWFADTEQKIMRAIEAASSQMFEARVAAGFTEVYAGHNRRRLKSDGSVEMLWRNVEAVPTGPLDPSLGVIRVDDLSGKTRAVLVNYACHAVVLGPDNRTISADYPGYLARRVEREVPGALCLFVQGGAGDINPYRDKQPVAEGGFAEAERLGTSLADAALEVVRKIKPISVPNPQILAADEIVVFRDRWSDKVIRTGLTTLLISEQIAIATIPGEPFVDLQIALRDKSEVRNTFLFGYTYSAGGDWVGYVPTLKAATEGGYGAGYNTHIQVGAGETMIDRAIVNLFRFKGRLRSVPR